SGVLAGWAGTPPSGVSVITMNCGVWVGTCAIPVPPQAASTRASTSIGRRRTVFVIALPFLWVSQIGGPDCSTSPESVPPAPTGALADGSGHPLHLFRRQPANQREASMF